MNNVNQVYVDTAACTVTDSRASSLNVEIHKHLQVLKTRQHQAETSFLHRWMERNLKVEWVFPEFQCYLVTCLCTTSSITNGINQ